MTPHTGLSFSRPCTWMLMYEFSVNLCIGSNLESLVRTCAWVTIVPELEISERVLPMIGQVDQAAAAPLPRDRKSVV